MSTFTTNDGFKRDFTFRIATESLKYDQGEFQALVADANKTYDLDICNHKKVLVSAPTLAMFAKAACELAAEGYSVLESERAHSSSLGHYAVKFVKPSALQAEDRQWIKDQIQELYLARIDANVSSYKAKLKADLLAEEKAKEAVKQAEAEAKKQAKLQQEADKKFEQLLQEQGIA